MKKFLASALAITLIGSSVASFAQDHSSHGSNGQPRSMDSSEMKTFVQCLRAFHEEYNKNKTSSIFNLPLRDINTNISSSFIGFFNDLFLKPADMPWRIYIPMILERDQRYTYIGVLCIFIAVYMLAVRK